jgi:F0F1-type ATP synthase assembly protein I
MVPRARPCEGAVDSAGGETSGPRFAAEFLVMAKKARGFSVTRATQSLQENASRSGPAAGASYTLVGAILLLGGLGYAVDSWQGTSPWFLLAGLALGIIVGFYELIKTTWPRS